MWSYKTRVLLRSLRSPHLQIQVPSLIPPSSSLAAAASSSWSPKPRFFFSSLSSESPSLGKESEVHASIDSHESPTWDLKDPYDKASSPINLEDGGEKIEIFGAVEEENTPEIDPEQVKSAVSILCCSSAANSIGLNLDKLHLSLREEFVSRVIEASDDAAAGLIGFFKWVLKNEESAKSSRTVGLLVRSVTNSTQLTKLEAYALWDLVKELGKEEGLLNTEILNEIIAMFRKLEKGKAGLEVFSMFD